jgi:hypothetical protein
MKWKRTVSMLLFSVAAFAVIMACYINGVPFVSQTEPTATRRATRLARATFTPRPPATETPEPSPTEEPTEEPEPTDEPTAVPVTEVPTRRPATARPTNPPAAQPTNPPPPPTTNPYPFGFVSHECKHSGGSHVFVVVFSDYKNPSSQMAGARVAASYAPDALPFGDTYGVTGADGSFDYVMQEPGVWTGTTYAWVVDKDNKRISEIGGPVELNDKGPDDAGTCHHVKYFFARGAP